MFAAVGFSMGGYVAREIVRAAPDRATALILIATSARADSPELQRRKALRVAGKSHASFGGLNRAAIASALHPDRAGDASLIDPLQAMAGRLGGEVFRRQSLLARQGDLDRLGDIRLPTLILAGGCDRLRSLAEAEELRSGIPGAELVVVEGVGHMIPMEAPKHAVRIVTD